eukprot:TRINITY_DN9936_c0_g1_i1.p1 TRINITY_DN9936_c0_g1~~TRINITY_DN9936_c0_g1_i1.p1  ORF type:complete len:161 (+),score=26.38 TRINITY_DN9936_c0_g1_i1:54-485(+)
MSDFSAVFQDQQQLTRRTTPISGGNAEKHRANKADVQNSAGRPSSKPAKYQDELTIDDFLSGANFERQGGAACNHTNKKEQVITDNVEEIEKKMWESAPKQGDYKLDDAWDQAYKEMVRSNGQYSDETVTASSSDKDDEFDVY